MTTATRTTRKNALIAAEAAHASASSELQQANQSYSAARAAKDWNGAAAAKTRIEVATELVADAQARVDAAHSALVAASAAEQHASFLEQVEAIVRELNAERATTSRLRATLAAQITTLGPRIHAGRANRLALVMRVRDIARRHKGDLRAELNARGIVPLNGALDMTAYPMDFPEDAQLGDPEDGYFLGKIVDALSETPAERRHRRMNNKGVDI